MNMTYAPLTVFQFSLHKGTVSSWELLCLEISHHFFPFREQLKEFTAQMLNRGEEEIGSSGCSTYCNGR